MNKRYFSALLTGASVFACITAACPAAAASEGQESNGQPRVVGTDSSSPNHPDEARSLDGAVPDTGEIVVTAQRRAQRIQDVPISITAASGTELTARGVVDSAGLGKIAPGVQVSQYGSSPATTSINIRGVVQLDAADHQESPNAVYLDGAYVSFQGATGIGLYDIDRVEVLRGPQGTLFGRNATGGLVQIISRQPTSETSGYINLGYGSYNQARVEGALGGALSDTLSARAAFLFNRQDGYVRNSLGRDGGADKTFNGRLQLKWTPAPGVSNLIQAFVSHTPTIGGGLYDTYPTAPDPANHNLPTMTNGPLFAANCQALGFAAPPVNSNNCLGYQKPSDGPFKVDAGQPEYFRRTVWGLTDTLSIDIGEVKLTSITNYTHLRKAYGEDTDSSPQDAISYYAGTRAHQISEEIRLAGSLPRFQWTAGAYYLNISGRYSTAFNVTDSYGIGFGNAFTQNVETFSVFGQSEYALTDKLSLISGLRWTTDRKKFDFANVCTSDNPTCAAFGSAPNGYTIDGVYKKSNWSGRLQLTYKVDQDLMLYAGVNRGIKGQVITAPSPAGVNQGFQSLLVKPEVLTAYEIGFKSSLMDRRIHFNADVFYYHYHDYQAYNFVAPSVSLFNAQARIYGAEAEFSGKLTDTMVMNLSGAYLHTKIGVTLPDGSAADQQAAFAPKFSMTGSLAKTFPTSIGDFSAQVGVNYSSSRYFSTINSPALLAKGYVNTDLTIGYKTPSGKWDASLQITNLTNKKYITYMQEATSLIGAGFRNYAPPRWVRFTIGYHL